MVYSWVTNSFTIWGLTILLNLRTRQKGISICGPAPEQVIARYVDTAVTINTSQQLLEHQLHIMKPATLNKPKFLNSIESVWCSV